MKTTLTWFEKPLHWGNILLIITTLFTYIIPLITPKISGWLSILGLMYPILLILNLMFLAYWLFRKQYTLVIITILTIFLGWNYLSATFGVNYFERSVKAANELTITSYNVRNFRISGKWDKDRFTNKIEETLAFYSNKEMDIHCFQELNMSNRFVKGAIEKEFEGKFMAKKAKGLLIVSKYPIINNEVIQPVKGGYSDACLFADIQIENDLIIRVYNIHLESNNVTTETENLEINTEKIQSKSTWRTIFNVFRNIKNNQKVRVTQMEKITEHIQGSPYPVLICGDFNDTPLSYTYHLMSKNLNDTFIKKGKGRGKTYNGKIPFLKIDYIFSDYRFKVKEAKIYREYRISDHFPTSAMLYWE